MSEHRIALPSRYRVLRHIANGGMASVWAAQDELLGRLVAVKVLSPAYAEEGRANRRFLREARAGARLSECRHVVTVYDIGEHDSRAFMVMEHFAGGTVADRLRSGRPIPRAVALRWLRETAEALDCAHRHDVVHRDVKPANLLLDERGRLAVGDFGIATVATEASVTQTGQVLGTAAYISPEQARGEPATAASDRYALAVVAFELLTGRRLFPGDHPAAQARAHVEQAVPAASAAGTGLPPAVDAVLRAGLAKDPARRPTTAADLLDALEDALEGGDEAPTAVVAAPAPVRPPREPASPPPAAGRAPRRRWAAVAALAVIAAVAGVVVAIVLGGGSGSDGGGQAAKTTARQASAAKGQPQGKSGARGNGKAKAKGKPPKGSPQGGAQAPQEQATPAPASATSDDPVALNDQGFRLLQQGQAPQAVEPLQRSVTAYRAQGKGSQIGYAYALYNLGNALRLSGRPAEAIPYLEERLAISTFKRGVVRKELATARAAAG